MDDTGIPPNPLEQRTFRDPGTPQKLPSHQAIDHNSRLGQISPKGRKENATNFSTSQNYKETDPTMSCYECYCSSLQGMHLIYNLAFAILNAWDDRCSLSFAPIREGFCTEETILVLSGKGLGGKHHKQVI